MCSSASKREPDWCVWSLADLFRAYVSRLLLGGLFLMLVALRWLPLHLILGFLAGRGRKGRDKGPSILIHLLQQESTALSRSSTQQTWAHTSKARSGSRGCPSCKGGWENWGLSFPAFTGEVVNSHNTFCHLRLLYCNRMPNEPDSEDLKNLPRNYIFLRYPIQSLESFWSLWPGKGYQSFPLFLVERRNYFGALYLSWSSSTLL